MPQSRALRTARGSAAAFVSTLVALVGHVAAGGEMPGPLGIIAPLVLATTVCVLLAGRRLSAPRLTISVVASQILFHTLFVLGTVSTGVGASGMTISGSHHAVTTSLTGTTAGVAADFANGTPAMDHGLGASPTMWLGHLVAAAITIAALHRGETALIRLGEMTLLAIGPALPVRTPLALPARRRQEPPFVFATEVSLPSLGEHSSPFSLRGPPALSAQ